MDDQSETMLPGEAPVTALFEAYRNGFDDFDPESILDCFAFPVTIWQLGRGNVFTEREDLAENIDALLAVLEREEVVRTEFELVDLVVEDEAAFAVVDWSQEREDGEAALAFRCHYTLVHDPADPQGWRIALVVNE